MADIFHEVDEEVRRERLKKIWDRYGIVIIAAAFLVVAGVGGWRGYEYWQGQKAETAGAAFEEAVALAESGKHSEAEAAFAKVAAEGTPGYRPLARLRWAAELATHDRTAAVTAYDNAAGDAGMTPQLRDLASLRAALLLVDTAPLDEMRRRLEPLAAPDRVFRHTARELLVLASWRGKDATMMRRWAEAAVTDVETPPSVRQRIETITALSNDAKQGS